MNNRSADLRGVSSPAPCPGAERRDKVLDEVSTAFHGGAAAVETGYTLPPKDDNNAGLTPRPLQVITLKSGVLELLQDMEKQTTQQMTKRIKTTHQ